MEQASAPQLKRIKHQAVRRRAAYPTTLSITHALLPFHPRHLYTHVNTAIESLPPQQQQQQQPRERNGIQKRQVAEGGHSFFLQIL